MVFIHEGYSISYYLRFNIYLELQECQIPTRFTKVTEIFHLEPFKHLVLDRSWIVYVDQKSSLPVAFIASYLQLFEVNTINR